MAPECPLIVGFVMNVPILFVRPRYIDIPVLMEIEQDASRLFAGTRHEAETTAGGLPASRFKAAMDQHLVWSVLANSGHTLGFGLVIWLESGAHLHELSVRRDWTGRGIGSRLLAHIAKELASRGHTALTLSTFNDVPWNAPFYAKHGFHPIQEDEMSPALGAIRRSEARGGLNMAYRVLMTCDLPAGQASVDQ